MPKNTGRQMLHGWRPFQNRKRWGGLFGKRPTWRQRRAMKAQEGSPS